MSRIRRMAISFVVVINLAAFFLVMTVIGNGSTADDLVFLNESDARVIFSAAVIGIGMNLVLGWLLWRGSLRTRDLERRLIEDTNPRTSGLHDEPRE